MQGTTYTRAPVLFWVFSLVLLVWGLAGASIYVALLLETPGGFAESAESHAHREAYAEYVANIPVWAITIGIGAALARLLGAICLLLRRAWALPLYLVSLVLLMVAMFRAFVLANAANVMSGQHIAIEAVFVALSIFAVWFAHRSKLRGILK